MRRSTKVWLIVAASLILAGAILFVGAMTAMKWNFKKLSTEQYETNTWEIQESFSNIRVETDTADLRFLPSEDGRVRVVCYESVKQRHEVSVSENTLTVKKTDTRKWYEYISVSVESPKLTVYLPAGAYGTLNVKEGTGDVEMAGDFSFTEAQVALTTGDVRWGASVSGALGIHTTTGDLSLSDCTAGELSLKVNTGDVRTTGVTCEGAVSLHVNTGKAELSDLTCKSVSTTGTTGDITLKNVIATESMKIRRDTGDVRLERCDAGEIEVKTDTGSVTGSLRSAKIFVVKTDTGRVSVPDSVTGGLCRVTTDTGSVRLTVE